MSLVGPRPLPVAEVARFDDLLRVLGAQDDRLWRLRFTTCHPRDVAPGLVAALAEGADDFVRAQSSSRDQRHEQRAF